MKKFFFSRQLGTDQRGELKKGGEFLGSRLVRVCSILWEGVYFGVRQGVVVRFIFVVFWYLLFGVDLGFVRFRCLIMDIKVVSEFGNSDCERSSRLWQGFNKGVFGELGVWSIFRVYLVGLLVYFGFLQRLKVVGVVAVMVVGYGCCLRGVQRSVCQRLFLLGQVCGSILFFELFVGYRFRIYFLLYLFF